MPARKRSRGKVQSIQGELELTAEEALSDYDENFLECRALRHAWRVVGYYRQAGEVRQALVCMRCPMERTSRWTPQGDRISLSYRPPEGYYIKGAGVTPWDVRHALIGRVTVHTSEAALLESLFTKQGQPRRRRAG